MLGARFVQSLLRYFLDMQTLPHPFLQHPPPLLLRNLLLLRQQLPRKDQ